MANDVIKLTGENQEHSDHGIEEAHASLPDSLSECVLNEFGIKAQKIHGVSEDLAQCFTTPYSLQALEAKISPEIAVKFNNEFQALARLSLETENAELALYFENDIQVKALAQALYDNAGKPKASIRPNALAIHDEHLAVNIALQVTKDSATAFKGLTEDSTVTQALKLGVPLKDAFQFDINYKLEAWNTIKYKVQTEKEKSEGIADAIHIDSHTKLEALKEGVPAKKARQFIHATQVDAWRKITSNDTPSLTTDQSVAQALQINTSTKLVALQDGVDPETASNFINQYQTDAWSKKIKSMKGYSAEAAIKIDTEIKLHALFAEVAPEFAVKFTDPRQVDAWKIIIAPLKLDDQKVMKESVAFAIATTKDAQLEALRAGVPPSNAVAFVNEYQIEIWNQMQSKMDLVEILKLITAAASFKSRHQANVLLSGADFNTAIVAVSSTHEQAYKYGVTSPNLLKKFNAQHQIDLLAAGIDTETASETGLANAQRLLYNSDPKKYREEMITSFKDHTQSFSENPMDYMTWKVGALVASVVAGTALLGFALFKLIKCASACFNRPATPPAGRVDGGAGLDEGLHV